MRIALYFFPRILLLAWLAAGGCDLDDDPSTATRARDGAASVPDGGSLEGQGRSSGGTRADGGSTNGASPDGSVVLGAGAATSGGAAHDAAGAPGEGPVTAVPPTPTAPTQIALENERAGTEAWQLTQTADNGEIEAYADRISYAAGETVSIAVGMASPSPYVWTVYRLGYYGGLGAREMLAGGPLLAVAHDEPFRDPESGLIEARWPAAFQFDTRDADGTPWITGTYLVKLAKDDGFETYAVFVVRDDTRDAEVYLQLSTSTWLAYNRWGGESLYVSENGFPRGKSVAVSYDRPFHAELGWGAGTLLRHELFGISWMEERGYDVEYGTNWDVAKPDGDLGDHRIFVAVGHDEYATLEELERLEAARDRGVSLAFLSGDTMYWQVRYEDDGRTMICYKDYPEDDPLFGVDDSRVTTKFRDPPVNRPENALIGVMSYGEHVDPPEDWVVMNADHWIYQGTGLENGDRLSGVVGNEWDTIFDNGHTPDGIVTLASSPIGEGGNFPHDATIYERGDAFVFAASSIFFARSLHEHPELSTLMENVMERAGASAQR